MSENPQPSQGAPIDEYRVLWTAQKKQKLKKWHDGFLRFHKFNKRLLVYDDARHLVADMYLRGRDTIDEGDNLEFENHLVTVEDFKGTVVQDLTPLFTSVVKRKQQIQAGNNLINPETPNQANRHGPWGPNSWNATPILHQGPIAAVARSPQTPVQRRPTNTSISLQQSIRTNNNIKHPHPYQGRPQAQAQNRPTRIEPPPQRSDVTPNTNPPIQQLRRSGPQRPDTSTFSTTRQPPLNALGGPPSPNGRLNQPHKQAALPEPAQDHHPPSGRKNTPLYSAQSHVDRGFDLNGFSGVAKPLKPSLPQGRQNNIFSKLTPINKSTPNVAIDTDSDDELFGPPPDFNIRASPPLAQKADLEPICAPKRSLDAFKNPDNNSRAFRPPSTKNTVTFPNRTSSTSRAAVSRTDTDKGRNSRTFQSFSHHKFTIASEKPSQVVAVDSISITNSGDESEKEKGPSEPLVSAGTILLGGATKRKRSKLLCQRPSSVSPKEPFAGIKERESASKKPRREPPSRLSPPPIVVERDMENGMAAVDTSNGAPLPPSPAVKEGLSAFKFQPPKKLHQNKGDDKSVADHMQYRIEEQADTIEYQKEHDIGPWSSEAFDLFDWRPPSMREEGK